MENPVSMWHNEHVRFERLLNYLEQQMAAFREGLSPHYELMAEIISYLSEYADRAHHPREDVAFKILSQRDPALLPLVQRLSQEHRVIDHAGALLLSYLSDIVKDVFVKRENVEAAADTFLVYYRNHIQREEESILPAAVRLMTDQDWQEVVQAVPSRPDPVFGALPGTTYRAIQAQLKREGVAA